MKIDSLSSGVRRALSPAASRSAHRVLQKTIQERTRSAFRSFFVRNAPFKIVAFDLYSWLRGFFSRRSERRRSRDSKARSPTKSLRQRLHAVVVIRGTARLRSRPVFHQMRKRASRRSLDTSACRSPLSRCGRFVFSSMATNPGRASSRKSIWNTLQPATGSRSACGPAMASK